MSWCLRKPGFLTRRPKDVLAQTPKSVTWKFFKFLGSQNSADKTKVICSKHPPYYPVGFIIVLLCFCCLHFGSHSIHTSELYHCEFLPYMCKCRRTYCTLNPTYVHRPKTMILFSDIY